MVLFFAVRSPSMKTDVQDLKRPDFYFKNMDLTSFDKGEVIWKLKSDFAVVDKGTRKTALFAISGGFLEKGLEMVKFKAPRAVLQLETSSLTMSNPRVFLQFPNQKADLSVDRLIWDSQHQQFLGEGHVQLKSSEFKVKGNRLSIEIPLKRVVISEHGQVEMLLPSDKP